jgi:hypothetical protein
MQSNYQRLLANFGAMLSWFTLITQLVLILQNSTHPALQTVITYFSFFTILTNLWVALFFTALFFPESGLFRLLNKGGRGTALAVYISIVCLVYQTLLRPVWDPQGLQRIIDELLHSLIPFYFVYYWFSFIDKKNISFSLILPWSVYLLLYILYILTRGAFTGLYPYPFIDVSTLGYPAALLNTLGVILFYVLLSMGFIMIAKRLSRT